MQREAEKDKALRKELGEVSQSRSHLGRLGVCAYLCVGVWMDGWTDGWMDLSLLSHTPTPSFPYISIQVDRLLQDEAARVSRATKDWNALAEATRRDRFLSVVAGVYMCMYVYD